MNPVLAVMALSAMGVVGVTGLAVLPPDSQFEPTTPSASIVDPWAEIPLADPLPEASERPLPSPQTSEPAPEGYCPTLVSLARLEGFSPDETALLTRIAWHESRCDEKILGDLDLGVSWGILQIHGPTWCEPSRYWPSGYLQAALILETCDELLDPAIAVKAARAIVLEAGFEAWSTYSKAVGS